MPKKMDNQTLLRVTKSAVKYMSDHQRFNEDQYRERLASARSEYPKPTHGVAHERRMIGLGGDYPSVAAYPHGAPMDTVRVRAKQVSRRKSPRGRLAAIQARQAMSRSRGSSGSVASRSVAAARSARRKGY